uniref:VTT domain-containing protein n=1 Tax=Rhizochromulina marina TaxID=1034831 RepID=A0A7S2WJI0_9STRA|mmetsp:Transcript_25575/g.74641  ORF Transcript_25575/g.74641 Transcript_25575/m.74641 type:complete len:354 (+) Transcript_25575:30-1091(+)
MHKKMEDRRAVSWRWRAALCPLAVVVALAALALLSRASAFTETLHSVLEWFQNHRALGAWLFLPFEAVWIIVLLPTTPIELACGFIFGWKLGFAIDFVGKLAGCLIAFTAARQCKTRSTWSTGDGNSGRLIQALDQVFVADPRRGTRLLLLLQLAFLPVALKNYGLALTSVPTWVFAWTTAVGEVPGTLALVYSGASASRLVDTLDGSHHLSTLQIALLVVESSALLLVLAVVGYKVTRSLRRFGYGERNGEAVTCVTDPLLSSPHSEMAWLGTAATEFQGNAGGGLLNGSTSGPGAHYRSGDEGSSMENANTEFSATATKSGLTSVDGGGGLWRGKAPTHPAAVYAAMEKGL